jgi:hypothetical protein
MFPNDLTGELSRQRIADLHAEADRQRLVRAVRARPAGRSAALHRLATTVALVAIAVVEIARRQGL